MNWSGTYMYKTLQAAIKRKYQNNYCRQERITVPKTYSDSPYRETRSPEKSWKRWETNTRVYLDEAGGKWSYRLRLYNKGRFTGMSLNWFRELYKSSESR